MSRAGAIYVDGHWSTPDKARISPLDHGFLYGDGVFETLRTYGGRPFRLRAHLERLSAGRQALGIEGGPRQEELETLVLGTLRRSHLEEAYLRITVSRGINPDGMDPAGCIRPTVVIAALPMRGYPPSAYEDGISAVTLWPRATDDHPPPTVKSTSFQRGVLARRELNRRAAKEGLYLAGDGSIAEGTVSNVFILQGGTLLTPPPDRCLRGITRAEVLDLTRELGMRVDETAFRPEDIHGADEAFVTSSLAEVLPVTQLDGKSVGAGAVGPVSKRLLAAYRARALGT